MAMALSRAYEGPSKNPAVIAVSAGRGAGGCALARSAPRLVEWPPVVAA